jgi:hypothetical protein
MSPMAPNNPLAPPSVQGISNYLIPDYMEMDFGYPFTFSLSASQTQLGQVVSIIIEADFLLRGLIFTSDGSFKMRFQDGQQFYTSPDFIYSVNMPNTAGDPFPVWPEIFYPAGGRITIDIADLSAAPNTGQILFKGASRYKLRIA